MRNAIGGRVLAVGAILVIGLSAPIHAAFHAEYVDTIDGSDLYFVSYQRGKMTRGGLLDTEKKARRKLLKRSHEFCLEQGFKYLKFPSLGEIARNEDLAAIWKLAAGDAEKDSSDMSGNLWQGTTTTHKSRDLLILSHEADPDTRFEECTAQ